MNTLVISLLSAILMGLGATLTFDLWGLFLKQAFQGYALQHLSGRALASLHASRNLYAFEYFVAPQKSAECTVGWIAHYLIGITFAIVFVALVGNNWLQHPTLIPAIVFGVVSVLAPFCIMQPSLGLGFAASKTLNPTQARLRSLMNHTAFGVGLYLFGMVVNWVLSVFA